MDAVLSLLWVVICVAVVLALAYWVTKYVALHGRAGVYNKTENGGEFVLLSRLALGKDQQLAVVRVGERCYLLGVTAAQITLLAELTPEEAASWQSAHDAPPAQTPVEFGRLLRGSLQQLGRR
jgi:flagellar biosynthetic protein FliO